jgi:hypothetical protein
MSRYLVDRLLANPRIAVRGGTEVTCLDMHSSRSRLSARAAKCMSSTSDELGENGQCWDADLSL